MDITPQSSAPVYVLSGVFFLDPFHGWIVVVDFPSSSPSKPQMRVVRTDDGGMTWNSFDFEPSSYRALSSVAVAPSSLTFSDPKHGWFLWKAQTGSAFSTGKLLATEDGGATWTELPNPPSGNEFCFHTQHDGWMTGGASSDKLWITHDGGSTWAQVSVPLPGNCAHCRPIFKVPCNEDAYNAVLPVTFVDDSSSVGRQIQQTYITSDGGESWEGREMYEESGSEIEPATISLVDMHAIRIYSDTRRGLRIRRDGASTTSSLSGELPRGGHVVSSDFIDDMSGWIVYQVPQCSKFRKISTDGAGLPCKEGVWRNDMLATSDGGKTFMSITPKLDSATIK
jgi:photosystem II stability/assembly factor-like uncharacterized protein